MKLISRVIFVFLLIFIQNIDASIYGYTPGETPIIKITPILGYEQTRSKYPDDNYQWNLMYGVSVSVGMTMLSLEVTGLRSQYSRTINSDEVVDVSERVQVGLVSKIYPLPILGVMIRAGGQGERRIVKATPLGGVESIKYKKIHYSPYAGAGISIPVARSMAMEITANAVFHDFPNELKNTDLQYTMGLKVAF